MGEYISCDETDDYGSMTEGSNMDHRNNIKVPRNHPHNSRRPRHHTHRSRR